MNIYQHEFAGHYGPPWPYGLYKRFDSTLFDDSEDISDYEYDYKDGNNQSSKEQEKVIQNSTSDPTKRQKISADSKLSDSTKYKDNEHDDGLYFGGGGIDLGANDDSFEYIVIPHKQPSVEVFDITSDGYDETDSDIEIVSGPAQTNTNTRFQVSHSNQTNFSHTATVSSTSKTKISNEKTDFKPTYQSFGHQIKSNHHTSKESNPNHKQFLQTTSHSNKGSIVVKEEWISRSSSTREGPKKVKQSTLDHMFFKR